MNQQTQTKATWFLVARRTGATIFSNHGRGTALQVVAELDNPQGALQSNAIETDRPGRTFDRAGYGRHGLGGEETAREHVERVFAQRLADFVDKNRCDEVFDQLVLVAGPKLLGELRAALSRPTKRLVTYELNKEISPTERQLREHLAGVAPL